ncbi:MAG: efflux RND transporter permease subunit [Candidatus Cloacimonetes bacterium]|nr:efflux RND transporter permease subunit [Candidatus Cloacimonadota bacterium]
MKLVEFSVNRRVTVLMITLLIVILGGIALSKLGLELLPDMDYPIISIVTMYEGASPEDIEETITKTIETAVATVKNVKTLSSESMENASLIMVEFDWGTNLDFAAQDLRDMIDQVADYLPEEVSRPLVMKFNLSQMPVLMYGATGGENTYKLRKILEDEVATKLKHQKGVASVMVYGGDDAEKQIIVDKEKLAQYGISVAEVVQVVSAGNLNMSAGYIQERNNEYFLRTMAQYGSLDEISNLPLKRTSSGETIYLKNVARVEAGFREARYFVRTDKKPTALFWISKESGANTLKVSQRIKDEMEIIKEDFEGEIIFAEVMDMGRPIAKTTSGAVNNLLVGGVLAILIMYLFLRNWRPTFAISLAIPISVIATFVAIYMGGFSLNIMTLGGLALGVGMLVDNSIVVIENIYRHLEMGKAKIKAAIGGASEVAMAITASTLTTIAVFFPMIFAEGMTGILVRGLALTVAFSLSASLFVSLTLVPALASIVFRRVENRPQTDKSQEMFIGIKDRYQKVLVWVLAHKTRTIVMVVILLVLSLALLPLIGTEFMPEQDIPFMLMNIKMPIGTPLEETDAAIAQIEDAFLSTAGVRHVMALVGPMTDAQAMSDPTNPQSVAEAQVYVRLYEQKDREVTYEEIQDIIRKKLPQIDGSEYVFLSRAEMMGGGQSNPIEINIFGKDLGRLQVIASDIEGTISRIEHVADVVNSMKEGRPEAHIIIDKEKAFQYGLTSYQIALEIKTSSLGTQAGIFREEGEEIDILVRVEEPARNSFEDILHLPVLSPLGVSVPLNQIAHIEYSEGPIKISREKQSRKVKITANITGTSDLGAVVKEVQNRIQPITDDMPPGYYVIFGGAYQDMKEAFGTLALALLLSIVLVYIVMASQFESLRQPFVVMFTMPLAVIGVMLMLFITGTTLSVASFVGGIILAGIVVNNGIVLIDHINKLKDSGFTKYKAILQAGSDRIRPVLITASTTVLGMLPMAISSGEGSELKAPMALTVIGGLISATFLTLVVIPVVYSIFVKEK